MNAAARLVHQSGLARHLLLSHWFNRKQVVALILAFVVLLSALSVIYVTHVVRVLHATYQANVQEQYRLHVQQGQLLLERSTWMMQARIEQVASNKLDMIVPDHQSVVIVHE